MIEKQKNIMTFNLSEETMPSLSKEAKQRLNSMKDEDIDFSDIPDLSQNSDFWTRAELEVRKRKKQLTLRLDQDIIEWFKSQGKGYQTKINAVLRTYINAH